MHKALLLLILVGISHETANAQRINFKTFVQDETITLTVVENPIGLNFNTKFPILVEGDPSVFNIQLSDFSTIVIEIDAPLEYDLTLDFQWSKGLSYLGLDTGTTVPFGFRIAYNNTGENNDMQRRLAAIEVPSVFNTVTLPVRRRVAGGPPLPPPTPDHNGFVRPRAKAYVFLYGTLGPIPMGIRAGTYSGEIQLNVNYSDNAF